MKEYEKDKEGKLYLHGLLQVQAAGLGTEIDGDAGVVTEGLVRVQGLAEEVHADDSFSNTSLTSQQDVPMNGTRNQSVQQVLRSHRLHIWHQQVEVRRFWVVCGEKNKTNPEHTRTDTRITQ